ncbi:hypothetical protein [Pseudoalteromonas ulvae]|uniref:Uncharacterized protein n=1 Tax=Pseudoalteromonas ulvae TaxID=107327 RepID=A0A244CQB9_PSEDV|nr:hypothetical protein [Pseudoalteromonas ulvae]OUL57817.1 hypothetical protein B1199_12240 [Pseudoalteromonas ulvae]
MFNQSNQQPDLWQDAEKHRLHAELCNAFYAREILRLSKEENNTRLCRILASLPYYIERAAGHIISGNNPLQLDSQNGSWIAKQAAKIPNADAKTDIYFTQHAKVGLIVPIKLHLDELEIIKLDCIDEVSGKTVHCNEHGWFSFSGPSLDSSQRALCKPTKAMMTAACCGHGWLQGKRTSPRRLSLREMLLAANINWQNFAQPLITNRR